MIREFSVVGEPRPAGGGWQSRLTSCLSSARSSSSTSYSSSSAALSAPSYASKSCSLALRPSSVWLMDCTPPTSCALLPSCLSRFVTAVLTETCNFVSVLLLVPNWSDRMDKDECPTSPEHGGCCPDFKLS